MPRPVVVMLVDHKTMAMLNFMMMVRVNMRLFTFPPFVLMLMVFIMIMWMLVINFKVSVFECFNIIRWPTPYRNAQANQSKNKQSQCCLADTVTSQPSCQRITKQPHEMG